MKRILAAAAAAGAIALGAVTPAAAATAHRIEWRHSGLCLTAASSASGARVTLRPCGRALQEWRIRDRRIHLAGTSQMLAVELVGSGPHAWLETALSPRPGAYGAWRYRVASRSIRDADVPCFNRVVACALRWRPGTSRGRRAWLDGKRFPASERWALVP